ncbi:MAG: ECF-type sigma factor [Planctomycetota bacterium]|jgi:RNA polymerase sigma factor (TIGR02999 family)
MVSSVETTQILVALSNGDRSAAARLMPAVYNELRELAGRYMAQEPVGHTLQPTALVHEAYIRLIDQSRIDWKSRAHFFGMAAEVMRHILVDHARRRRAAKRGADAKRLTLTESIGSSEESEIDLLDLDEAMGELDRLNERQRKVVDLRFFGGLKIDEAAHVLGVSPQTVRLDWRMARAWLRQRLSA